MAALALAGCSVNHLGSSEDEERGRETLVIDGFDARTLVSQVLLDARATWNFSAGRPVREPRARLRCTYQNWPTDTPDCLVIPSGVPAGAAGSYRLFSAASGDRDLSGFTAILKNPGVIPDNLAPNSASSTTYRQFSFYLGCAKDACWMNVRAPFSDDDDSIWAEVLNPDLLEDDATKADANASKIVEVTPDHLRIAKFYCYYDAEQDGHRRCDVVHAREQGVEYSVSDYAGLSSAAKVLHRHKYYADAERTLRIETMLIAHNARETAAGELAGQVACQDPFTNAASCRVIGFVPGDSATTGLFTVPAVTP
jgi:hypothetical protein